MTQNILRVTLEFGAVTLNPLRVTPSKQIVTRFAPPRDALCDA